MSARGSKTGKSLHPLPQKPATDEFTKHPDLSQSVQNNFMKTIDIHQRKLNHYEFIRPILIKRFHTHE